MYNWRCRRWAGGGFAPYSAKFQALAIPAESAELLSLVLLHYSTPWQTGSLTPTRRLRAETCLGFCTTSRITLPKGKWNLRIDKRAHPYISVVLMSECCSASCTARTPCSWYSFSQTRFENITCEFKPSTEEMTPSVFYNTLYLHWGLRKIEGEWGFVSFFGKSLIPFSF